MKSNRIYRKQGIILGIMSIIGTMLILTGCPSDTPTPTDTVSPTFTAGPSVSVGETNATISVTVDEASTLFWVLYANDVVPDGVNGLINDAANDGGVASSGSSGVALTAGVAQTINIDEIDPDTAYDFYAVARDAAENSTLSQKIDIDTTIIPPPAFTPQPSVATVNADNATVSVTVDKTSTLFWVLYANNVAPAGVNGLINDAANSGGVASSGSQGVALTANMAQEIMISGLDASTDYDFYAVARDSTQKATLSNILNITTLATPDTTFPIFTPQPSKVSVGETNATISVTVDEASTLFWVLYANDVVPDGVNGLINDAANDGGVASSGSSGVALTAGVAQEITIDGLDSNTDYDFYAVARDNAGNPTLSNKLDIGTIDITPPTFTIGPSVVLVSADGTVVSVTVNEASTLFWVLYTDGVAEPTITALIADASGSGGVARSGSAGVSLTANTAQQITISGLSENTAYDFYAVARDVADNPTLSDKLNISTSDITAPTFTTGPSEVSVSPDSIVFTVTVDEASTLFWVIYTDGVAPTNAAALIDDVANNGGVARSDSAGVSLTANTATQVTGSGLSAGSDYDLYAVARDAADNPTLSEKLEITTPASDLVVQSLSIDNSAPLTDTTVTISATVLNSSTASASSTPTMLRHYQSSDTLITTGDTEVGAAATIPVLAVGTTSTHLTPVTAPSGGGTYYYGVCIDLASNEANVSNNCSSAVMVTVIPSNDIDNDGVLNVDDVDRDNNGLIEIDNFEMLNNVRYNLDGTTYDDEAADSGTGDVGSTNGAPTGSNKPSDYVCDDPDSNGGVCGYELTQSLDFADANHYGSSGNYNAGSNVQWRANDIDTDVATNAGFPPIGADFNAIFEGNSYTITNLYIRPSSSTVGLFSSTASDAHIRNLGLVNNAVYGGTAGNDNIGALIGTNAGAVSTSYATGTVKSATLGNDNVGGLVGDNDGTVSASYVLYTLGKIIQGGTAGGNYVGGLVGSNSSSGTVIASYTTSVADGHSGPTDYVGALVGFNQGTVSASYATGSADGGAGSTDYVGGLVGGNFGASAVIRASYTRAVADGSTDGNDNVGGLVGYNLGGMEQASYSLGLISGAETDLFTIHNTVPISELRINTANNSDEATPFYRWAPVAGWIPPTAADKLSLYCDINVDGSISADEEQTSNLIWNFGSTAQFPAINCTPDEVADQPILF